MRNVNVAFAPEGRNIDFLILFQGVAGVPEMARNHPELHLLEKEAGP